MILVFDLLIVALEHPSFNDVLVPCLLNYNAKTYFLEDFYSCFDL